MLLMNVVMIPLRLILMTIELFFYMLLFEFSFVEVLLCSRF